MGWDDNLRKGVDGGMGGVGGGTRACFRMVGMGAFPAPGNSFEVGEFPKVAVFWNKGAPAVMGAYGSGTPFILLRYV